MTDFRLTTPVALIIFNRPDTTARVFAEVAKARPPKLLVVGDGPRTDRSGEEIQVAAARAIINQVNWPCEVSTNFSDTNLGCRNRVSSGIDWIFEQVEEAIILEDDCLPDPSFFHFCQDMLEHYRHDQRIGMISGNNFQQGRKYGSGSYYFSKYAHIWGWATWRRAWKSYDVRASIWPRFRDEGYLERLLIPAERPTWCRHLDGVYSGQIDTWDYQWTLTCWANSMLTILPQENLISNIGFGMNATHTKTPSRYASMATSSIQWPLLHPSIVAANALADARTAADQYSGTWLRRLLARLSRLA